MSPFTVELAFTVFAAAAAIGLSPYASLAAIGLVAYSGAIILPLALTGLATPSLWVVMVAVSVIDGVVSHFRLTDLVWNVLHTIVRPITAFLFAALVLAAQPADVQWLGSLGAFLVALLVHISVLAVRTAARTAGPQSSVPGLTAARLLFAALLMVAAVSVPWLAAAAAAILVFGPLAWSPRLWGAATLAITSVVHALIRPERRHQWTIGAATLPWRLRRTADTTLGRYSGPLRHCRATLARLGARWPYWRGRIVVAADRPVIFLHYRGLQPRVIPLDALAARIDPGPLIETLHADDPGGFSLCLGPEAPTGPVILTVLGLPESQARSRGTSLEMGG